VVVMSACPMDLTAMYETRGASLRSWRAEIRGEVDLPRCTSAHIW